MSFFLFFVVLRNILFCGDVRDCLRLLTDLPLDMPVTGTVYIYWYLQYMDCVQCNRSTFNFPLPPIIGNEEKIDIHFLNGRHALQNTTQAKENGKGNERYHSTTKRW